MNEERKRRIEFGDFQTPDDLALAVCRKLVALGIQPDTIVEPTCGVGAFVLAAAHAFAGAKAIHGCEINPNYLHTLQQRLQAVSGIPPVHLHPADFFTHNWAQHLAPIEGHLLILGNFPWVTSAQQGAIGGENLPAKSNFQGHSGFDAMTGKSNFDISEWMTLQAVTWFKHRCGTIAMLVKTAVARKVLAQAQQQGAQVSSASIYPIDAKKNFGAAVDACLLVIQFAPSAQYRSHEYTVFPSLDATQGARVGHRDGRTVGDLDAFDAHKHLIGSSPQKWRSGIKHDASAVMEFTRTAGGLVNGLGEIVTLEDRYLFPLLKGSDIGSGKAWRQKFVLVPQRCVGDPTTAIQFLAPKTWAYLESHAPQLDNRGSAIYANNPRFSIFGIGDYAFRPWKIAICALYKKLEFRLVEPILGKPVMFDDTVYFISFDTRQEAEAALDQLNHADIKKLLASMIFWDEKRPIKTSILNAVDFAKVDERLMVQASLI